MSLSVPDIQAMLINLTQNYTGIYRLINAFCFVSGMAFFLKAIHYLKVYGEMRMMMSSSANIKEPLMYFFVGTALIYLPSLLDSALQTVFSSSQISLLQESDVNFGSQYYSGMSAVTQTVQLVGYIAFVRGIFMLSKTANASGASHGASVGKAVMHMFGGVLAINIVETKRILWASVGF